MEVESWSSLVTRSSTRERRESQQRYEKTGGQCWRCRSKKYKTGIHHINGNRNDEKPQNLLRLCKKCHDLVQGICDQCSNQADCYVQKLQRCWRFEDSLPPIEFRPKERNESYDSHPEALKPENLNEIHNLIKLGHTIQSSMITETYLSSASFLDNFIKCDICGNWVRWKLSPNKERLICARCTIQIAGSPGWFKKKLLEKRA